MKIWVGVTDKNWYEHLIRLAPEEVNFWQPSGQPCDIRGSDIHRSLTSDGLVTIIARLSSQNLRAES